MRTAAEVHVLTLRRLEELAKRDVDAAYQQLTAKITYAQMASVFDTLAVAAREIVGKYGPQAVAQGRRFAGQVLGTGTDGPMPAATDLAAPLADADAEIAEHGRHTQQIIKIRAQRMTDSGMDEASINTALQQDFEIGGRWFGLYRNAVKRSVAGAIQGLGQAALYAAYGRGNGNSG